jgi:hypothetical protein
MCSRTHRKKFGQSLNDPQKDGKQILVHIFV